MNRRQRRQARYTPDLPIRVDCTRPLNDQLTPDQLAWVKQWTADNECPDCGWAHTPDMACVPATETDRFLLSPP